MVLTPKSSMQCLNLADGYSGKDERGERSFAQATRTQIHAELQGASPLKAAHPIDAASTSGLRDPVQALHTHTLMATT